WTWRRPSTTSATGLLPEAERPGRGSQVGSGGRLAPALRSRLRLSSQKPSISISHRTRSHRSPAAPPAAPPATTRPLPPLPPPPPPDQRQGPKSGHAATVRRQWVIAVRRVGQGQAEQPPLHRDIPDRGHLPDPPGALPCPRSPGIEGEPSDLGHDATPPC